MGWLKDFVDKAHGVTKYAMPIEHVLMDNAKDSSSSLVNEGGNLLSRIGGESFVGQLGDTTQALSQRDKDESFGGWGSRTLVSAASYVGGAAAGEAMSGAGSAGSAAGSGGEALGGTASTGGDSFGVLMSDAGAGTAGTANAAGQGASVGVYAGDVNTAAQGAQAAKGAADVGYLAKAGTALKTYGPQAYSLASSMAQKKPGTQGPAARPVTEMPDPQQQAEARRRKTAEQLARRGRVASIMTSEA